jgi:serine/threonine protein kinase
VVKLNREALIDFNSKDFDTINAESTLFIIVKFMIAKNLLQKMLEKDPKKRITASQALKHPFLLLQLNN